MSPFFYGLSFRAEGFVFQNNFGPMSLYNPFAKQDFHFHQAIENVLVSIIPISFVKN
jgi:hypothetical protein